MKKIALFSLYIFQFSFVYAQEGRPALVSETVEDVRVKKIIHDALPHEPVGWRVDDESNLEGITCFHSGDEAAKTPFTHEYKIRYVKEVSEMERQKWQKEATTTTNIQRMIDETECELNIFVNSFYQEINASKTLENRAFTPFNLSLWGIHGARFFIGNNWTIANTQKTDEGKVIYTLKSVINQTIPASQIQTITFSFKGSQSVVEFFLKNMDLKSLQNLIGQNKISLVNNTAQKSEKVLQKLIEGNNIIEFTLDGGVFQNKNYILKHSNFGEFAYLKNNHPNHTVTENAVTRVLIQEDDDFKTKNKTGFLDITIPFIRKTGVFEVSSDSKSASFSGGINCWDGCEYSFNPEKIIVEITRYDPVNGFIEGNFKGEVKISYKLNQPIDNADKEKPNAQIKGFFKVRRKEDRY